MPQLASKYNCTGCMGCHDRCPKEAISIRYGCDGHRYVDVDTTLCVECGLCEKVCPVVNGREYGSDTIESHFLAGWSNDKEIRMRGATSGVFGSMAKSVLTSGGAVIGTRMEGLECKYCVINKLEDLGRLQGSKYVSSNPAGIYKAVENLLLMGKKVLFCGLPCHVAACLSYINPILKEQLTTVDLVCGGVSSPKLLDIFCDNTPGFKEVISFRDKRNGWNPKGYRYNFRYLNQDGSCIDSHNEKKNLVTDGFACELTDRYSCYRCQFAKIHRESDITIGDLWGDTKFKEEHREGVSLIIVHSEKGLECLRESDVTLQKIEGLDSLKHNRRTFYGKSIKRFFPERLFLGYFINHFSYAILKRIYAGDLKTKNILWWPFALWRLCSFRLASVIIRNRSNIILKKVFR